MLSHGLRRTEVDEGAEHRRGNAEMSEDRKWRMENRDPRFSMLHSCCLEV
jgi:hypothetical protein